jgi:hypothetical protein
MAEQVDEQALLRMLREEEQDAATYFDSELAREQALALDRYFARPYGDGSEVPNRSQIVTRDVQDAVNWLLPHALRHFTSADDLISVHDDGLDDGDATLQDSADYLRHVVFNDNAGEEIIHDFLFDGLVQRIGVIRAQWEIPPPCPPQVMTGLMPEQVEKYAKDKRYTILAAEVDGETTIEAPQPAQPPPSPMAPVAGGGAPPMGLMGGMGAPQAPGMMAGLAPPMAPVAEIPVQTYTLKVQRQDHGQVSLESFPPENFRISRRARSIREAPYHGGRFDDVYLAELIRDHPDKAYDLDPNAAGMAEEVTGVDSFGDERVTARFPDELDNGVSMTNRDEERRRVVVMIEYIRGDFDRDGVVELRRVKRTGDVILENEVVTESEFTMWSPIRVSHRAIGLSLADTLLDIQRIRTVLTRRAMDSLSQSLSPRTAVNKQAIDDDGTLLDRLLDHEVGDVIPVNGNPTTIFMPLVTPDVSPQAFQAIEYWDRRSEEASGINRHAMGIQPQAITDTKGGIDMLQAAANSRIEQYVRWAALGLEEMLGKVLRLLIKHQDHERAVKINGRKLSVDPRRWSDEMTVTVHVGLAAESREKKLAYLGAIAAKQEQIMLAPGGVGMALVSLQKYRHTLARMVQAMGEKSADAYFEVIDPSWKPPPPGPDPKTVEAQEKGKLAVAELQQKGQLQQAEMQMRGELQAAEFQRDTELQRLRLEADEQGRAREADFRRQLEEIKIAADAQAAAQKAEIDRQLAELKAANEMRIAQMRIEAESAIARDRMEAEMDLARFKTAQEVKVSRYAAEQQGKMQPNKRRRVPADNDEAGGIPAVQFGGQIG